MIIYHAITSYQLICCIVHAMLLSKQKNKMLIIPTFIARKFPQYMELESKQIFNKIVFFNYAKFNGKSSEFILSELDKEFENVLPKLDEVSDIYVGGAQYYFSVYLINHKKEFSVIEEGAGLISRMHLLKETLVKQKIFNIDLLEQYGLMDLSNPYIKQKLCLMRAQDKNYVDTKLIDFDVEKALAELEDGERKKIKDFFRCPSINDVSKDSVLLLTQQFANLSQLTFENQILIYQTLFDFFFESKKVVIKPHPDDIMYYEKLFPSARVIKEKFPSELLPFIFYDTPHTISTVSSTGVHLIAPVFSEHIIFDTDFEKQFIYTERYYAALRIAEYLGKIGIDICNCSEKVLHNLQKCNDEFSNLNLKIKGNKKSDAAELLIVGEVKEPDMDIGKYRHIIFLNINNDYGFSEAISLSDVFPIRIRRKIIRQEENYYPKEDEYIYVYSRGGKEELKEFEFRKTLTNCGEEISVEKASDKDIYIMALEGQIKAMERQILFYKQKEKAQ